MSNEPNGFAKYLVIFVDILGSQNRVDFQETYKINKIFHEELERNKQNDMMHTVYFRKIYTFSDCAYIFYGFKDGISDERTKTTGRGDAGHWYELHPIRHQRTQPVPLPVPVGLCRGE